VRLNLGERGDGVVGETPSPPVLLIWVSSSTGEGLEPSSSPPPQGEVSLPAEDYSPDEE